MKYINRLYIVLIITIFISIGYLYKTVSNINNQMIVNIENILISKAKYFAQNIDEELKNNIHKDIYTTLKNNPQLRANLEHMFSVVITPSFKYIYILYRDQNGKYRYLIDGSKEDKGDFDQTLNVDREKWDKVYTTQKAQIFMQKNIDGLWITYLKPIIFDEKVEAVLAIDFSTRLLSYIDKILAPIDNVFLYIFGSISILLLILLYQVVLNIKTKKESITDPLTLVYNRNYLRDFLKKANPAKYQIAILDIDHFKKVNDNYGHKAGDYILVEVARIIKETIRQKDIIIRFGGEEFLIFFYKDKNTALNASEISNRLRENLEKQEFYYEDTLIKVTASIGVVLHPEHFKSMLEAIKKSDEKLYIAKREGRNKVIMEENIESTRNGQVISIHDVKEALDTKRVICQYQPIIDLKTNKVIKYEALVRIRKDDGSLIYPNSFLDTVTNTNVYNDITKQVLDIVFQTIKKHHIAMSINLNLSDILDNVIYNIVLKEIKQNKELAQWLTIELLEYEQISTDILKERLLHIKSYGVKIALDDFGSGYSNFSIFEAFPIDILKIDGSLIQNINTSEISYSITEAILLFAKKLNITTIAEFIHNEEVLKIVQELGVEQGQGFYLGKPSDSLLNLN